jgi:phosphonate transport system ATP-binding protein
MIFQQHQLIARFTALQNTLLGGIGRANWVRTLFPASRSEKVFALECLERVGLLEKAETRVDNLSGGQQQRVGIARSLFQQPTILLADEPVASLDPETSKGVLTLMHSICAERGLTAVVSLHQVDLAKAFADRIIGLADGGIVYDGIPEEISIDDLAIIYTRGAAPALSATGNDVVSDLEEEAACAAASQW